MWLEPGASEFLELALQLFVGHPERIFFDLVLPDLCQLALVVGIVGLQLTWLVHKAIRFRFPVLVFFRLVDHSVRLLFNHSFYHRGASRTTYCGPRLLSLWSARAPRPRR